ncbi:MAG: hypothetical protein ACE5F1_02690 [Planctomycetota bacterium]
MDQDFPRTVAQKELDLLLAEQILAGGFRGARLFEWRRARDQQWILGVLDCLGIKATAWDIEACLRGTAGRFLPEQREFALIHGMRLVIDRLDDWAEGGTKPDAERLAGLYRLAAGKLPRVRKLGAEETPEIEALAPDPPASQRHPVEQAGRVYQAILERAPFPDLNPLMAGLASSAVLLPSGYPPFMPQAVDEARLAAAMRATTSDSMESYARILFLRFVEVCEAVDRSAE